PDLFRGQQRTRAVLLLLGGVVRERHWRQPSGAAPVVGVSWRGYAAGDLLLRRGAAASERGAAPRTPGGGMGRRGCCLPVHARELQPHRFADDQLTAGRVSRLRAAVDGLPPAEECAVRACRLGSGCLDV